MEKETRRLFLTIHGAGCRGNWKVYNKDGSEGLRVGPLLESEDGMHESSIGALILCSKSDDRGCSSQQLP